DGRFLRRRIPVQPHFPLGRSQQKRGKLRISTTTQEQDHPSQGHDFRSSPAHGSFPFSQRNVRKSRGTIARTGLEGKRKKSVYFNYRHWLRAPSPLVKVMSPCRTPLV